MTWDWISLNTWERSQFTRFYFSKWDVEEMLRRCWGEVSKFDHNSKIIRSESELIVNHVGQSQVSSTEKYHHRSIRILSINTDCLHLEFWAKTKSLVFSTLPPLVLSINIYSRKQLRAASSIIEFRLVFRVLEWENNPRIGCQKEMLNFKSTMCEEEEMNIKMEKEEADSIIESHCDRVGRLR